MKRLAPYSFSYSACRRELDEFGAFLQQHATLSERDHVLPFFRQRSHLSVLLASYHPRLFAPDVFAHEYPIRGDFRADLIVGDSGRHHYLLVEFEDGRPDGLFAPVGRKATTEWSPRFEHAFSQLVDWLWALEDLSSTGQFSDVFGHRQADFSGLIVVGKGMALTKEERSRLRWRNHSVLVHSKQVSCVSFDQLYLDLDTHLTRFITP